MKNRLKWLKVGPTWWNLIQISYWNINKLEKARCDLRISNKLANKLLETWFTQKNGTRNVAWFRWDPGYPRSNHGSRSEAHQGGLKDARWGAVGPTGWSENHHQVVVVVVSDGAAGECSSLQPTLGNGGTHLENSQKYNNVGKIKLSWYTTSPKNFKS